MLGVWILSILIIIFAALIFPWWFLPLAIIGGLISFFLFPPGKKN